MMAGCARPHCPQAHLTGQPRTQQPWPCLWSHTKQKSISSSRGLKQSSKQTSARLGGLACRGCSLHLVATAACAVVLVSLHNTALGRLLALAWPLVCRFLWSCTCAGSREIGSLGALGTGDRSRCVLLAFAFRLLDFSAGAWHRWCVGEGERHIASTHWCICDKGTH